MSRPNLDWMDRALCAEVGGDAFFPNTGEPDLAAAAKRVCAKCPVAAECFAWGMAGGDVQGVYGGTGSRQRAAARNRRRGAA